MAYRVVCDESNRDETFGTREVAIAKAMKWSSGNYGHFFVFDTGDRQSFRVGYAYSGAFYWSDEVKGENGKPAPPIRVAP